MIVGLAAIAQYGLHVNALARERELLAIRLARMNHADRDFGPFRPFHPTNRIVGLDAFRALALDLHDPVPGLDARSIGRSSINGAEDFQFAVLHRHVDADTAEFVVHRGAELGQLLGTDVGRVRIELGHYAADGGLDQFAAIDLFHIVSIDLIDRVGQELIEFVVVILGLGIGLERLFLGVYYFFRSLGFVARLWPRAAK